MSGSALTPHTLRISTIRATVDRRQDVQDWLDEEDRRHGPRRFVQPAQAMNYEENVAYRRIKRAAGQPVPFVGVDIAGQPIDLIPPPSRMRDFFRWLLP